MKTTAAIATFLIVAAFGADAPPDLTGQDVAAFKGHVGRVVSLRGKLRKPNNNGMTAGLIGAGGKEVVFYIRVLTPPQGRAFWPKSWTNLVGQHVRVIGELGFQSLNRSTARQDWPDYFYMEQHSTKIAPLKQLHR